MKIRGPGRALVGSPDARCCYFFPHIATVPKLSVPSGVPRNDFRGGGARAWCGPRFLPPKNLPWSPLTDNLAAAFGRPNHIGPPFATFRRGRSMPPCPMGRYATDSTRFNWSSVFRDIRPSPAIPAVSASFHSLPEFVFVASITITESARAHSNE